MAKSVKDILIVDDAENNLILLSDLLAEFDYSIRIAKNANDAIHLVNEQKPDLLLLDIMMPDMDGFELLDKIKAEDPAVKAIFITAKSNADDREKAFNMGAADFITKPVNIIEVMEKVQATLSN